MSRTSRTDVQDTLREMWSTRPARPRDDRQIAGVAAAIARRYDIDPVLVRVGFVVAAFSGIGAALYIAGWILLPGEPGASGRARRPRIVLLAGLGVSFALTVGAFVGNETTPSLALPIIAVAALLYLLHRSRGSRVGRVPADGSTTLHVPPAGAPTAAATTTLTTTDADALTVPTQTPPAWDPLGAAPFAWDLPEPSPPPPPPPPRRLPVTPVTLGLALIAGGLTSVIMLMAGELALVNLPVLFGVVLAVIGLGLLVGAFVRSGRGLIPFALILSALTWAAVAAPLDRWQGNEFSDLRIAPATVAEVQPSYERAVGEIALDLRSLDLAVPPNGNAQPLRILVNLGAGDVSIRLPENADVTFNGSSGIGAVSFENRVDEGPGAEVNVLNDLGSDGVRGGRPLIINVEAGLADVEVRRG